MNAQIVVKTDGECYYGKKNQNCSDKTIEDLEVILKSLMCGELTHLHMTNEDGTEQYFFSKEKIKQSVVILKITENEQTF